MTDTFDREEFRRKTEKRVKTGATIGVVSNAVSGLPLLALGPLGWLGYAAYVASGVVSGGANGIIVGAVAEAAKDRFNRG